MEVSQKHVICPSDFGRTSYFVKCVISKMTSSEGNFRPFCFDDRALMGIICDYFVE